MDCRDPRQSNRVLDMGRLGYQRAGKEVARTWLLYMAAARLGFERGDLDVCQLLLAKPDGNRPARRPLRPWW